MTNLAPGSMQAIRGCTNALADIHMGIQLLVCIEN